MTFVPPPKTAAWRHTDVQTGFEVVYFRPLGDWHRIEGCTTGVEAGRTWVVGYAIDVDSRWITRRAEVTGRWVTGSRRTTLEGDGDGHWLVDGVPAPHLDGCLDVDLESSAMTNAFPVHRMRLAVGTGSGAPAAYVRSLDLAVERLEQQYVRVDDDSYDYVSPADGFSCRLVYDEAGFVLDYPGIAVRAL
ncbi:putative glycolipid-binding domain-containing protein [Nonomuraea sp. NBC_00507]|uniref:putative glycolipid-binding domain-containing protein n=1 Tax=Nonomuraea sp. NBC_00507 TaxID=2976002 RepID=UPI002E1837EC